MGNMNWSVIEVTQPPAEPITVSDVKDRLRIDTAAEDTEIGKMIESARRWVENYLERALVQRQLRLYLDEFPASDVIVLPRANLITIDSVQYVDSNGNVQTWDVANYTADTASFQARLIRGYGVDWPTIRVQRRAVMITYTAGYDDDGASPPDYTANIPQDIIDAITLKVGELYEFRENRQKNESYDTEAAINLLNPYRDIDI